MPDPIRLTPLLGQQGLHRRKRICVAVPMRHRPYHNAFPSLLDPARGLFLVQPDWLEGLSEIIDRQAVNLPRANLREDVAFQRRDPPIAMLGGAIARCEGLADRPRCPLEAWDLSHFFLLQGSPIIDGVEPLGDLRARLISSDASSRQPDLGEGAEPHVAALAGDWRLEPQEKLARPNLRVWAWVKPRHAAHRNHPIFGPEPPGLGVRQPDFGLRQASQPHTQPDTNIEIG